MPDELPASAAGDRLGAALRLVRDRREWRGRIARIPAAALRAAEAALVVVSAFLATRSLPATLGLMALLVAAIVAGYATRVRDAETEAQAAAHAAARRKLGNVERTFERAAAATADGPLDPNGADDASPPPVDAAD